MADDSLEELVMTLTGMANLLAVVFKWGLVVLVCVIILYFMVHIWEGSRKK